MKCNSDVITVLVVVFSNQEHILNRSAFYSFTYSYMLWYITFILSLKAFIFDTLPTNVVDSICIYGIPCFATSIFIRFCALIIFLRYIFSGFCP